MKEVITGLSNSLTVSTTTEALCMEISKGEDMTKKMYFIEYPTNIPPNHRNLFVRGNRIVELTTWEYDNITQAIKDFQEKRMEYNFLHAPSFLIGYLNEKSLSTLKLF